MFTGAPSFQEWWIVSGVVDHLVPTRTQESK